MKVFRDDKVYVQIKDLNLLFNTGGVSIPHSVFKKSLKRALDMTDKTKDEFVEFDEPIEIFFFKNISYIIDLDEAKEMSRADYDAFVLSSNKKLRSIVDKAKAPGVGPFQILSYNNKYKREYHKVVSVKEARYSKTKKVEAKIQGKKQTSFLKSLFKRRG